MPFSPHLFDGRVWASEPKRGDIAVFKLPKDGSTDYIKRVIGLPGDRIQMINGVLHINGKATERQRIEDYQTVNVFGSPRRSRIIARPCRAACRTRSSSSKATPESATTRKSTWFRPATSS